MGADPEQDLYEQNLYVHFPFSELNPVVNNACQNAASIIGKTTLLFL